MEDIILKLSKNKPLLVHNAFNSLLKIILEKKKIGIKFTRQSEEIKLLKDQCASDLFCNSIGACTVLVQLIDYDILLLDDVMVCLISCTHNTKKQSQILHMLTSLFVQLIEDKSIVSYSTIDNIHPFILILKQCPHAWRDILACLQNFQTQIIKRKLTSVAALQFNDCVFKYILCSKHPKQSESMKQSAWQILIHFCIKFERIYFLFENLAAFESSNDSSIFEKLCFLTDVQQSLHNFKITKYDDIFLMYYCTVIVYMIEHNICISNVLNDIKQLFKNNKFRTDTVNICMFILIQSLQICGNIYLNELLVLCESIITSYNINPLISNSLLIIILPWIANANTLDKLIQTTLENFVLLIDYNANQIDSNVLNKEHEEEEEGDNEGDGYSQIFQIMFCDNTHVMNSLSLYKLSNEYSDNYDILSLITKLSSKHSPLKSNNISLFLSGILVDTYNKESIQAIGTTEKCIYYNNTFQLKSKCLEYLNIQLPSDLIYLILYLLPKERYPKMIKTLLLYFIRTGVEKDNIPTILNTLEKLSKSNHHVIGSLLTNLYLELWTIEPRTFKFVLNAITVNQFKLDPFEFSILKAITMKRICETRPDTHGKELISELSSILSDCSDLNGSVACSVAIDAIRFLCDAGVIEFRSVWNTLRVVKDDKRSKIIVSLCELMSLSAYQEVSSKDTSALELSYEISSILWLYVATQNDMNVISSALKALSQFEFQSDYPLKYLHAKFRSNLKIPSSVLGKLHRDSKTPEEFLMFIPGESYVQVLKHLSHSGNLDSYCTMMKTFVRQELEIYKEIIYNTSEGNQKEPQDYSYLPYKSIIRALVKYVQNQLDLAKENTSSEHQNNNYRMSIVLKILSSNQPKQLPPLNWSFLNIYLDGEQSEDILSSVLTIMSKCSESSNETKNVLQRFMGEDDYHKSMKPLYDNLPSLCQYIDTNMFIKFLNNTLRDVFSKIQTNMTSPYQPNLTKDSEQHNQLILFILRSIKQCISILGDKVKECFIPPRSNFESNFMLLANMTKELFEYFDYSTEIFDHTIDCIIQLPLSYLSLLFYNNKSSLDHNKLFILNCNTIKSKSMTLSFENLFDYDIAKYNMELVIEEMQSVLSEYRSDGSVMWKFIFNDLITRLSQTQNQNSDRFCYLLISIVVTYSGYDELIKIGSTKYEYKAKNLTENVVDMLAPLDVSRIFPLSFLSLVQNRSDVNISMVAESIYSIKKSCNISQQYKTVFGETLLNLKPYITNGSTVMKILSLPYCHSFSLDGDINSPTE